MTTPTSAAPAGPGRSRVASAAPSRAAGSIAAGSLATQAAAAFPASDAEERTRDRVLNAVLEHGPISAAELGDLLGFTPAAVRRHLDHLSRDGVIEVKRATRAGAGAGRPKIGK